MLCYELKLKKDQKLQFLLNGVPLPKVKGINGVMKVACATTFLYSLGLQNDDEITTSLDNTEQAEVEEEEAIEDIEPNTDSDNDDDDQ